MKQSSVTGQPRLHGEMWRDVWSKPYLKQNQELIMFLDDSQKVKEANQFCPPEHNLALPRKTDLPPAC